MLHNAIRLKRLLKGGTLFRCPYVIFHNFAWDNGAFRKISETSVCLRTNAVIYVQKRKSTITLSNCFLSARV